MSTGGKSAIASCVFWFVAAGTTAWLHPSRRLRKVSANNDDSGLDEPLVKAYDEDNLIKGNAGETDNETV